MDGFDFRYHQSTEYLGTQQHKRNNNPSQHKYQLRPSPFTISSGFLTDKQLGQDRILGILRRGEVPFRTCLPVFRLDTQLVPFYQTRIFILKKVGRIRFFIKIQKSSEQSFFFLTRHQSYHFLGLPQLRYFQQAYYLTVSYRTNYRQLFEL